jgi:hypothetical protein
MAVSAANCALLVKADQGEKIGIGSCSTTGWSLVSQHFSGEI